MFYKKSYLASSKGLNEGGLLLQVRCIQLIDPDVDPELIFQGAAKEEENDDDDEDVPVS